MLFRRKKCVLYTRLRQLVTYYTYATQAKTKTVYDYTKFKYSYLTNPSLNVHRLLSSRPEHKLPPLMQIYSPSRYFSFLNFMKTIFIIRTAIDQNFDIFEFRKGVCQAITVISNALATQKYEELDGLVTERTLKILKHRVACLTPEQRNLLVLLEDDYECHPYFSVVDRTKGSNEAIIKIGIKGYTIKSKSDSDQKCLLDFTYIFQRKYINGVGGAWLLRFINYSIQLSVG